MMATEDKRVVRYTGTSHVHTISAADWKKAGVEGQTQVRWNRDNNFEVPASELNEKALEVLGRESSFTIS